jgi:hypothetical protein
MTRRDFKLIAAVIRDVDEAFAWDEETAAYIVRTFASALATTNPRFDWGKFEAACRSQ